MRITRPLPNAVAIYMLKANRYFSKDEIIESKNVVGNFPLKSIASTYIARIDGSAGGVVSTGLVEHLAKVFLEFAVLSSETGGAVANVEIIQGI